MTTRNQDRSMSTNDLTISKSACLEAAPFLDALSALEERRANDGHPHDKIFHTIRSAAFTDAAEAFRAAGVTT